MFHLLVPGGRWQTVTGMPIELLQLDLPKAHARAVRTAAVGADHQPLGSWITWLSHRVPPAADRVDRERRGIVVDADTHPTFVVGDIVDAIRHGAPAFGIDEVMDTHFFG